MFIKIFILEIKIKNKHQLISTLFSILYLNCFHEVQSNIEASINCEANNVKAEEVKIEPNDTKIIYFI